METKTPEQHAVLHSKLEFAKKWAHEIDLVGRYESLAKIWDCFEKELTALREENYVLSERCDSLTSSLKIAGEQRDLLREALTAAKHTLDNLQDLKERTEIKVKDLHFQNQINEINAALTKTEPKQ